MTYRDPALVRKHIVKICLSKEEHDILKAAAERMRLQISSAARELAVEGLEQALKQILDTQPLS